MKNVSVGLRYLNQLPQWKGRGGFTLDNVRAVLSRLGDPQDAYPSVHIAGTNGKGSVSVAIAAILGCSGARVGLNVSPHLMRMHERVVLDGFSIENDALGEFSYDVKAAAEKASVTLSFHEAITIVSFLAFREMNVDAAVFEVGLGGRLDASNVLSSPEVTAIVTIDYDHQDVLGSTLEQIAREKAGIIKSGCPSIVGRIQSGPLQIIEKVAQENEASCLVLGRDFDVFPETPLIKGGNQGVLGYPKSRQGADEVRFSSSLDGNHQLDNMAIAIEAARLLKVPTTACIEGVKSVFWPARLEQIEIKGRNVLLDCSHNVAGIMSLISFLDREGIDRVDLAFGVVETKDWPRMVSLIAPRVRSWRLFVPPTERGLEVSKLESEVRRHVSGNDVKIRVYGNDYDYFLDHGIVEGEDLLIITGSIYLVGLLRAGLVSEERPLWERRKQ